MAPRPHPVFIFFFIGFFLFISCQEKPVKAKQVKRAVYYWKNDTWLGLEGQRLLERHDIRRVYTKLMDIDWEEGRGAVPLGMNYLERFEDHNTYDRVRKFEFIPVIFITNKTFVRIDSADIPLLATRILRKCFTGYDRTDSAAEAEKYENHYRTYNLRPKEIQFDCDWTVSTASKYFYFLETVKKLLPGDSTKLSATIRLHQYKYPGKTGVPPVSRGMLMVYNIADLTKYTNVNSIFEYDKAKPYFKSGKNYSLPLDLALPAYAWGIVYRGKKFFTIEHGLTVDRVKGSNYFQPTEKNIYAVKKDTLLDNLYLRPGDEIKFEGIDHERLMQVVELSRKAMNNDSFTVSFFELSSPTLLKYDYETIEQVYNSYW
jgi:hypothetical protein